MVGRGRYVCPSPGTSSGQGLTGKKVPACGALLEALGSREPEVGILRTHDAPSPSTLLSYFGHLRVRFLPRKGPDSSSWQPLPLCGLLCLNSAQPRWPPFRNSPGDFSSSKSCLLRRGVCVCGGGAVSKSCPLLYTQPRSCLPQKTFLGLPNLYPSSPPEPTAGVAVPPEVAPHLHGWMAHCRRTPPVLTLELAGV